MEGDREGKKERDGGRGTEGRREKMMKWKREREGGREEERMGGRAGEEDAQRE